MNQLWTQLNLENKQDSEMDSAQWIISPQTVRKPIEKHKDYNLPPCLAFIDYEKAFDSVYTSAVVESLEDIGKDKPYINIIKEIYMKTTTTIRLDKRKAKIKLGRGVKQGDTISPKVFTAVLENYIRCSGVITSGWVIKPSGNITLNYERIRVMAPTSSAKKGSESSETQTTAKS